MCIWCMFALITCVYTYLWMIPSNVCQQLVDEPTHQSSRGVDSSYELRDHLRKQTRGATIQYESSFKVYRRIQYREQFDERDVFTVPTVRVRFVSLKNKTKNTQVIDRSNFT